MDSVIQDIRYGVRQLWRQRGSTALAVVTLALGIGAATAIFSVVDATMLRPLPYPDPEQLVSVYPEEIGPDGPRPVGTAAMEDVRFFQQATDVFSHVAGWGSAFGGRVTDSAEPERIDVLRFTEDYLPMHAVRPAIGREFTREEIEPGAPLVALLSHAYWQMRYAGRDVLGETIRLDDEVATIVGILPRGFNETTEVFTPLQTPVAEYGRRGTGRVSIYARLQPGITIEQARERLGPRMLAYTPSGGGARPSAWPGAVRLTSRLESALGQARTTVNVLAGAVGLLLLLACVNVAGVLLARGTARQTELAVRASLGAHRRRLLRQLLTEAGVVATLGCAVGVGLAWLSLDALVANIPMTLPANAPVTINLRVLAATIALLVPTVIIFGLVPALRLSRVQLSTVLARGSRQGALSRRGGQLLIAAEVALAVVLVAGAGLMIRSFSRLSSVDMGFESSRLITMQVVPLDRTVGVHEQYYASLLTRVSGMAGVQSAGVVDNFSLGGGRTMSGLAALGKTHGVWTTRATPEYLATIGATLAEGRFPTAAEVQAGARPVVISEAAAKAMFPNGPAVGQTIASTWGTRVEYPVVGIIKGLRAGTPTATTDEIQVFLPFSVHESDVARPMTLVMRVTGSDTIAQSDLRTLAAELGPRVLVESIRTGEELFSRSVVTPRRRTVLLGLLGGLGLVLALVGVFGITAYSVARRTKEVGVRMAFGAQPRQVVGTMMRDALWPVVLGAAVGVGGAAAASKVIESFLFQTSRVDPITLAAVAVLLVLCGCVAAMIPALRAARVDPVASLRVE